MYYYYYTDPVYYGLERFVAYKLRSSKMYRKSSTSNPLIWCLHDILTPYSWKVQIRKMAFKIFSLCLACYRIPRTDLLIHGLFQYLIYVCACTYIKTVWILLEFAYSYYIAYLFLCKHGVIQSMIIILFFVVYLIYL